jgi:hypothetical protein
MNYILKETPTVVPVPKALQLTVDQCTAKWAMLQNGRMTTRVERKWETECRTLVDGVKVSPFKYITTQLSLDSYFQSMMFYPGWNSVYT